MSLIIAKRLIKRDKYFVKPSLIKRDRGSNLEQNFLSKSIIIIVLERGEYILICMHHHYKDVLLFVFVFVLTIWFPEEGALAG
jgi:hypothetical protein